LDIGELGSNTEEPNTQDDSEESGAPDSEDDSDLNAEKGEEADAAVTAVIHIPEAIFCMN
jgi:hypothetical protein